MNKHNVGLALGCLLGAFHLVWALAVWVMPAQMQGTLDWIFTLHGFTPVLSIAGMTFMNMVLLVVVTFVVGYILGGVFAWFHNWIHKK